MSSFIKIIEIWTPGSDRCQLELGDSLFDENINFKPLSRQKYFKYDEGLPGKAWSLGYPQINTDLENSYFLNRQEIAGENLTSGISFPVFSGEFLLAVVVFLCGDKRYDAGAIELWGNNQEKEDVLSLVDGYYGSLKVLEHISRRITFPKGIGLPGSVWDYNLPVIIDEPANSPLFLRRGTAENDGITMAFGLPFTYHHNELVLAFLSTIDTPIANRFEIWIPERNHSHLFFHGGKCEFGGDLTTIHKDKIVKRGEGKLGKSWLSGCPQISKDVIGDGLIFGKQSIQFEAAFILPLIENGLLRSIVVLYF